MCVFEHVEKSPLENPLEKSDGRVPLPINWLARLALQYPEQMYTVCSVPVEMQNCISSQKPGPNSGQTPD